MLDRRAFLTLSAGLVACDGPRTAAARWLGAGIPTELDPPHADTLDPAHRLLNRAGFGPWPGDVQRVHEMGVDAWVEEQLHPEDIDDSAATVLARRFDSLQASPGNAQEWEPATIREHLQRHALLRAVHSKRQVYESMVALWTDHLNVAVSKTGVAQLAPSYLRDVIRAHALGNFRDLIRASALSPAMLVYLDGADNALKTPEDAPQENYARELLELHTLGVHGGYSQTDVMEAARCLTGWTVRTEWQKGTVEFHPEWHDDGPKTVLGVEIPAGGGADDLERLIDIAVEHPSTARYVATHLVRWFISDDPPEDVVSDAARTFTESGGDLRDTVRTVLHSDAFETAPLRLKRPFRFVVSTLRSLGAVTQAEKPLVELLQRMGQAPHEHPTPDGYPLEPHPWRGSLAWRWRFATQLETGNTEVPWDALERALGDEPETWFRHLIGRTPGPTEMAPIAAFLANGGAKRQALSLLLSSPAFQVH